MTSSKTEDKIIGMSLSTLLDMASEIEAEKTAFVESLRDELVDDRKILEMIMLSRTQTKTDLRRFKNVSVFMH